MQVIEVIKYNVNVPNICIVISEGRLNMNKLIVIDPGHGGRDPGAVRQGIMEKDINLKIAARLFTLLLNRGIRTRMTRTDDSYVSLADRVRLANQIKAEIFISIHCNSAPTPEAGGIETLYYPGSRRGRKLAGKIQAELINNLKVKDRGIKARSDLFVLKYTSMPAVLIECGFISNPAERELLNDDNYSGMVAKAIFCGIKKYYEGS